MFIHMYIVWYQNIQYNAESLASFILKSYSEDRIGNLSLRGPPCCLLRLLSPWRRHENAKMSVNLPKAIQERDVDPSLRAPIGFSPSSIWKSTLVILEPPSAHKKLMESNFLKRLYLYFLMQTIAF